MAALFAFGPFRLDRARRVLWRGDVWSTSPRVPSTC